MEKVSAKQINSKTKVFSFSEEISEYLAGNTTKNKVLEAFLSDKRIIRCANDVQNRHKIEGYENDLIGEACSTFYEKYLMSNRELKFSDPDDAYKLAYQLLDNHAKTLKHFMKSMSPEVESIDSMIQGGETKEAKSYSDGGDFEEDCVKEIDRKNVLEKMKSAIKESGMYPWQNRGISVLMPRELSNIESIEVRTRNKERTEPQNIKRISSDEGAHRIEKSMEIIGATVDEMASMLGLIVPTFSSYLYKRTQQIPELVVLKAERLASEHTIKFKALKEAYEGKSMDEILDRWIGLAGIERDAGEVWIGKLADFMDVNKITIKRWIRGENQPKMRKLQEYERHIETKLSSEKNPS